MGKGITRIDPVIIADWWVNDKRRGDLKELLLLPDSYQVEDVAMQHGFTSRALVDVTLSSPDIPAVEVNSLPDIALTYRRIAGKADPELAKIAVMDGSKALYEVEYGDIAVYERTY